MRLLNIRSTPYGEIYPHYSNVYNLTGWDWFEGDNCNGVLDVCDYIVLTNMSAPEWPEVYCHVEDICYDIILNKKIMNPICTTWHEVYPNYSSRDKLGGAFRGSLSG